MSSLKTTVSIEGELVDLAEVFKALAAAAAVSPRPEPRISGEPVYAGMWDRGQLFPGPELEATKKILKAEPSEPRATYEDSGRKPVLSSSENEGSTDEPETQEQSEQTGKRKRRTKAEIEADRLAAEQAAIEQANGPTDDVAAADEAVNAFEAALTGATQTEEQVDTAGVIAAEAPATETKTVEAPTPAPAPQPNTTRATVDGTSPFIAELRAFCQQKMLGKPENQVLIKNLLTEFGAAGLSALKEVDKMAFKQRLEALPFK